MSRPFDINAIRKEFPILNKVERDTPFIYLDSAASAQKPQTVINTMHRQMQTAYANVHRGVYSMANEVTEAFEAARETVRAFINANEAAEIIFTKSATEAINLVASGLGAEIQPGDEIILSVMEHHSNIVPWHFLRERKGAVIKWVGLDAQGALDMAAYQDALSSQTKIVALAHMSNVLGSVIDAGRCVKLAHQVGAKVLLDGCQAVTQIPVDVQAIGADFYAFSGHKLYGPTGVGVLHGRRDALEALPPYQGGGEMIDIVRKNQITYGPIPHKFEAGTPPIIEVIGLGAALAWLREFDWKDIQAHETELYSQAKEGLAHLNDLRIHGEMEDKGAILGFSIDNIHPHDIAQILDKYGVAIRAGHHCAQPLMDFLKVSATARASFGIYNTKEDVDAFISALLKARTMLI